jgi:predicted metal-dependent hydrolase
MPQFSYGRTMFEWRFVANASLTRHYVTVAKGAVVVLRGPEITLAQQEAFIAQRARWIRDRLAEVNAPVPDDILRSGSRLVYAGRSYYTEVRHQPEIALPQLRFTASRFILDHPHGPILPATLWQPLLDTFYLHRAQEKLPPRVRHWMRSTRLAATAIRIRHFKSRWANCTAGNALEFHPRVMALPASVLDYVIVHELCHTIEKNHTKAFWHWVALHMPDWQRQHAVLQETGFQADL